MRPLIVNSRRCWKFVIQKSATWTRGGILLQRILKGFEKYYEDLREGSFRACVIPRSAIRRTLEKFRAGIWQEVLTRAVPSSLTLTRAPVLSYLDYHLFLSNSLHLLYSYFQIYFYVSSSLCIRGSTEGSDTISMTEKQWICIVLYYSLLSILRDVGVPISAASALFFPLFAIPYLRIHIPPGVVVYVPSVSPYPLLLFCPVILKFSIVIGLYYCQKFRAIFMVSFCLCMKFLNFLIYFNYLALIFLTRCS